MKIKILSAMGLVVGLSSTAALASTLSGTTVNHIQIQNGIIATNPPYNPTVEVDFYNTQKDKSPCWTRKVAPEQQSDDYIGGNCKTFGKVEIKAATASPQAFSTTPITILPQYSGKVNDTIRLSADQQPVFDQSGRVTKAGTIKDTSGPWLSQ